jgi:hypothetical protein
MSNLALSNDDSNLPGWSGIQHDTSHLPLDQIAELALPGLNSRADMMLDEDDWTAESLGFPGWEETQLEDGNLMLSNPNGIDRSTNYLNSLQVSDDLLSDPALNDLLQPPELL